MKYDLPKNVRIINRTIENDQAVTLHLAVQIDFAPGQFLMIWIPGVDEKPFSIAGSDREGVMITVRRRGNFSRRLSGLDVGASVGVRGPYGKAFKLAENCCLVAGGVGFACLAPIADLFSHAPIFYGENTAKNRIYQKRFPRLNFYTVDGSGGKKGVPTDDLEALIQQQGCKMVYCCGPEPLIVKTMRISQSLGVDCQVAIERYMKCGIGICGQCVCGPTRVCVDGPVFDGLYLLNNPDFGHRRLDATGGWESIEVIQKEKRNHEN
ncbi:dihydroorotate dehydrogenase electron transfer subunit [Patescibacteria group bacterium]|nr:dihydroorotate dehydrogenase electron transfer subunit [Patescibacteria group bacterium]MBU1663440.1 dihydroorotate dehydrogenase electron transfer subunit [Patescibacteria group bacterium]MBU1933636.1 dihydroorotate dehydrogenase electron transfer subunit [Patescibacteria group bacterium]MBU2007782.1 dihydroorotate dehydrogenase electron transfer subunit [Patescibacteria group bacterium]MBU2233783.1 dihydroorotate dehydrogenase electron transfer subunit [Patescibacteria group bacterium]